MVEPEAGIDAGAEATAVAGLVLAAGRATRFGSTKQLAIVDGRPLVRRAADVALAAGLSPVVVVVGHDARRVRSVLPAGVVVVDNPDHVAGQASSLQAGIASLHDSSACAVVVLLADQPHLSSEAVEAVVAAHHDGAVVARASYDDGVGHPVLLGRSVWSRLRDLSGDQGARALLDDLGVVDVPVTGSRPRDVDCPDDLRFV
jgi:molybdenum cofactor cytidylyltransferase